MSCTKSHLCPDSEAIYNTYTLIKFSSPQDANQSKADSEKGQTNEVDPAITAVADDSETAIDNSVTSVPVAPKVVAC